MRSFCRPGDHMITECVYQILNLCSNALFLKFILEGWYSLKGRAMPLSRIQDTGVQTAHYNEQWNAGRLIKASWSGNSNLPTDLELHYKTMSSMSSSLAFQNIVAALVQSQQVPQSIPADNISDQTSTQNSNKREDHKNYSENSEESTSPDSLPGSHPMCNIIPLSMTIP